MGCAIWNHDRMVLFPRHQSVPDYRRSNPSRDREGAVSQWIKFLDPRDRTSWSLISPDGKTLRSYVEPNTIAMTFSADSKRLYGIRVEPDRRTLYSLDIATKEEKTIGEISKDFTPSSYNNPGIRLSLSPDGKSILYPATRRSTSLWMMEGFAQPGWLDQLREMLP